MGILSNKFGHLFMKMDSIIVSLIMFKTTGIRTGNDKFPLILLKKVLANGWKNRIFYFFSGGIYEFSYDGNGKLIQS